MILTNKMEALIRKAVSVIKKLTTSELKQVILVRADLKLPAGKMAAQVAHAALDAAFDSNKKLVDAWRNSGAKKIVLKVADLKELESRLKHAEESGLIVSKITDAGHTVVKPGTITCGAIGPDASGKIDKVTGDLSVV